MRLTLTFLLFFIVSLGFAQDIVYTHKLIDTLTSPYFWGRGYTKHGMQKTSEFLIGEFKKHGLKPMNGESFLQKFSYPVNSFPGKMEVELNGRKLKPGVDFIVSPESRGIKGKGKLSRKDSLNFVNSELRLTVSFKNKLTWSVARQAAGFTEIQLDRNCLKDQPRKIQLDIENKFIPDFKALNICGIVEGSEKPDSLIMITAHYDHLGGMGKDTYFPGANDNASGLSLLLNLAKYYAENPLRYSVAFVCFSGEEAGLMGSKYFTENPLIDLKNIRFLINLDLVGTGTEGITVVNATEFKKEFSFLQEINEQNRYLQKISSRGKAANSDHYWFAEKNVPSFFIYTMGGIKAYHDVNDIASTLPLSSYESLFKLITDFNKKLTN